jgi:MoaA/NifB/PqqE/SkfB family radical SAM enzyme
MADSKAPLYMVTWRCTRNCVGSCMYCSYTKEYAKDSELSTEAAKKMVDEIHDFGSPWFGISGGEPSCDQTFLKLSLTPKKNTAWK